MLAAIHALYARLYALLERLASVLPAVSFLPVPRGTHCFTSWPLLASRPGRGTLGGGKHHLTRHRHKDQLEGHLLVGLHRTIGGIRQQAQERRLGKRRSASRLQSSSAGWIGHQILALRHPAHQGISSVLEQQRSHVFLVVLIGLLGRALVVRGASKRL